MGRGNRRLYTFIVFLAALLSTAFFLYGKWLQYSFHCMAIQYTTSTTNTNTAALPKPLPHSTTSSTSTSSAEEMLHTGTSSEYSVSYHYTIIPFTISITISNYHFTLYTVLCIQWIGFFVAKEACLCQEFLSFQLFLWFSCLVTLFFVQLFVLQFILVARETTLNNVSHYLDTYIPRYLYTVATSPVQRLGGHIKYRYLYTVPIYLYTVPRYLDTYICSTVPLLTHCLIHCLIHCLTLCCLVLGHQATSPGQSPFLEEAMEECLVLS